MSSQRPSWALAFLPAPVGQLLSVTSSESAGLLLGCARLCSLHTYHPILHGVVQSQQVAVSILCLKGYLLAKQG